MSETQALTVQQAGAMVPAESAGDAFLEMLERAACNPNVDPAKLGALLGLKERVDAKTAEMDFTRDFSLASMEMPRVSKRGEIKLVKDGIDKGSIPFAKYEDIDKVIRPIEAKYGFTRSFTTEPAQQAGILMTVRLSHRAGHSITSTRFMPPDPGPGRNAMQAIGSASAYAKRYLTLDIWNIVTENADDDGNSVGLITDEQIMTIETMISACGLSKDRQKKLLAIAGVDRIRDIKQGAQFDAIMESLRGAERASRGASK